MFDFRETTDECIKCGKCIPVCTIHQVHPDETTSPRGFLHLLGAYQKEQLPLDNNAKDIFESCFLCTSCVEVCPASLPTDTMIEQVRADIADKYGIAWFKKAFFLLLRNRLLFDIVSKLGWAFKTCAVQNIPEKSAILPRFTLPIIKKDRLLPALKRTSFLNKYPESLDFGKNGKVAVFIGCLANYNYTEIGDSLLLILKRLGIETFIPKKQMCCSAPAYFTGDFATVDILIKKNVTYFESWIDDVDAVLVPEATCSSMMVHDWVKYLHDQPEWRARAEKLVKKVHIASGWLEKHTKLSELLKAEGKAQNDVVTYHDPCHSRKTQGVWREPRTLLGQNYPMAEMSNPNQCCGFGGVTMQTEKYAYAKAAGKPKAQMIEATGAKYVSAECSACRMQLTNAMYQEKVDTSFKHPLELIAKALTDAK
jgi:glycolate oxidase iron-sulfur subunit